MSTEELDPIEALAGLLRGIADSIREMTDEEVLEEWREDGGEPALTAEEVRMEMLKDLRRRWVDGRYS